MNAQLGSQAGLRKSAQPLTFTLGPYYPTMKKITKGSFHKLPSAVLYSGDVARICALLKEGGLTSITLRTAGYELESPEEFEQLAGTTENKFICQLEIKGREPYLSIEFEPYSARVYISDDSIALRGLQSKIADLVRSRARPFWRLTNEIIPAIPLPFAIIAAMGKRFDIAGLLFSVFVLVSWWSFRRSLRQYSVIETNGVRLD